MFAPAHGPGNPTSLAGVLGGLHAGIGTQLYLQLYTQVAKTGPDPETSLSLCGSLHWKGGMRE